MFIRFKRYQRVKNKSVTSLCLSMILPRDKHFYQFLMYSFRGFRYIYQHII